MMLFNFSQRVLGRAIKISAPFFRQLGSFAPPKTPKGVRILGEGGAHVFCGYYDVTPFHHNGDYLIALRCHQPNISPHETNARADIGYYDLNDFKPRFNKVSETGCWNWQQGCRLQWLPTEKNMIAYNDISSDGYKMVVRDAFTGEIKNQLDLPFYTLHKSQPKALGLNFSRLHSYRRGYGYHNFPDPFSGDAAPHRDGLWQIDLHDGYAELLVSYAELACFGPRPDMSSAIHYLNHLQWAPDGKTIIFFHQWSSRANKKTGRLIIRTHDGVLRELDPLLRPSHTAWSLDGKLIVTGHRRDSAAMYHIYDIANGERSDIQSCIQQDGHPSFLNLAEIISDTYPNLWGRQILYRLDINHPDALERLAAFYVPPEYRGEARCDFHPRLSSSGHQVAIDVVHNSFRAVAVIPLR